MLHAGEGRTEWRALADPFGFTSCDACDHKELDLRDTGAAFSQLATCTKHLAEQVAKLTRVVTADEKSWPSTNQRGRETFWVIAAAAAPSTSLAPGRGGGHFLRHPLIQAPSQTRSPLLHTLSIVCSFPPITVPQQGDVPALTAGKEQHPGCAGGPGTCWSTLSGAGRAGPGRALLLLPRNANFLTLPKKPAGPIFLSWSDII